MDVADLAAAAAAGPFGAEVVPVARQDYNKPLAVLAGLGAVDWVISFSEGTPENLLAEVKPDVLVKGGDYGIDQVVGAEIVRAYGGEVRVLGLVENSSTTVLLKMRA